MWLYEPEHAADWISSARNSLSAKHASRPHSWVMIVPNELYSQMRPSMFGIRSPYESTYVLNWP